MILEVVFVLSLILGGSALIQVAGARGLGVPILGAVTGLALYLCITAFQVLTPITSSPLLTLILTVALPVALWGWRRAQGADLPLRPLWAGIIVAGVIGAVAFFRAMPQVAWSNDSLNYLLNGSLIASNNITIASTALLPKRLIGVPGLLSKSIVLDFKSGCTSSGSPDGGLRFVGGLLSGVWIRTSLLLSAPRCSSVTMS